MNDQARDANWLRGRKVAFTGRLASMTRAEAAALVRRRGGQWVADVSRNTSFLVIGQEGWPIRRDGRLSRKLREARRLQRTHPVAIMSEGEFLDRLGLETPPLDRQCYSTSRLSELLRVPGSRIRQWVQQGLVHPVQSLGGVHYFDFRQVSWIKTLCDLVEAGAGTGRIRRSLEQLRQWLPDVESCLDRLAVLEKDGRLLVRLDEDRLVEATGQGLFDFGDDSPPATVQAVRGPQTSEQWFDLGCSHEEAERYLEAERAYRQALRLSGPVAQTCFNLGNVLYALGRKGQAAERFSQAAELLPDYADAWNNLGNVLQELGQHDDAVAALRRAVDLDPASADAHYNLADALDGLKRIEEARAHWQCYLHFEPSGPWADYARRRLTQTAIATCVNAPAARPEQAASRAGRWFRVRESRRSPNSRC